MADMTEAYDWRGRTILDPRGEKIGTIDQVYLNLETDEPEWALVDRGLFGRRSTFVPVGSARPTGEDVTVEVAKDQVKSAPDMEGDAELSPMEEAELLRHYGSGRPEQTMTRSEEELHVSTVRRPHTRVRLRKYVVTEMVTKTVPVRHEEVRLEREPVSEADATSAPSADGAYEMVLHEEQLVIEKRVVPTERVRLVKETIFEERTVGGEVRKEQIEAEGTVR